MLTITGSNGSNVIKDVNTLTTFHAGNIAGTITFNSCSTINLNPEIFNNIEFCNTVTSINSIKTPTKQEIIAFVDAALYGDLNTIKDLHESKHLDLNARHPDENMGGMTALMASFGIGCFDEIAEYLIVNGADVNACDNNGNTALIEAVRMGRTTIVELLLNNGARIGDTNFEGKSALDVALDAAEDRTDIISLLFNKSDDSTIKTEESTAIDTTVSHPHFHPGKGWEEFKEDNGLTLSNFALIVEEVATNNDDLSLLEMFDGEDWVVVGAAEEFPVG